MFSKKDKDKKKGIGIIVDILLMGMFFLSLWFLFNQQANYSESAVFYRGDLAQHLSTALNGGGYSLMASFFRWIYRFIPSTYSISFFLAVVILLTVLGVAFYISKELHDEEKVTSIIYKYIPLGIGSVLLTSLYIPGIWPYFYKGTYFTQPWHNATYFLMRCVGVIVLLVYFKIEEHYLEYISWRDAFVFTVLLVLVNYAKPNFIIAFAPMMLIYLIADFVRTEGKSWGQNTKFGICVLLSLPILYVQSTILYPSGGDSKIEFTVDNFINLFSSWEVIPYFLSGMLFPVLVTVTLRNRANISKKLQQSWVMWFISWGERIFITETGARAGHGNFGWGSRFFSFFLYIICTTEWIRAYREKKLTTREFCVGCICGGLYVICGIYYYVYLLSGMDYLV